jgi:hypothetical protein
MEEPSHVSQVADLSDPTETDLLAVSAASRPVSPAFPSVEIPPELCHHDETRNSISAAHNDRQSHGQQLDYDYTSSSSSSSTQPSTSSDSSDLLAHDADADEEELAQIHSRASSRSSVSSLPDSVLIRRHPGGPKQFSSSSLPIEPDEGPHEELLSTPLGG